MILQAPTRSHRRMVCHYYVADNAEQQRLATSLSGNFEFELPDDTEVALYLPCEGADTPIGGYAWDGDAWEQVALDGIDDYLDGYKEVPGPAPEPENDLDLDDTAGTSVEHLIDPELFEVAEKYTAEYAETWKAVNESFKKVTKAPK